MITPPPPEPTDRLRKQLKVRPWFVVAALAIAGILGWLAWPRAEAIGPIELSRMDGKSRFYVTTVPRMQRPPNLTLPQRVFWVWYQFNQRYKKPNPAAYKFAANPVQPCSIHGLLNQCMEVGGTKYLIAVEIAGAVEFGHTNTLNGAQWVAAFEHAIETSGPVICYDWAKKRNFQDTLVLIRERPRVVKIVPRSKLVDYKKAGLVKEIPPASGGAQTNKL